MNVCSNNDDSKNGTWHNAYMQHIRVVRLHMHDASADICAENWCIIMHT